MKSRQNKKPKYLNPETIILIKQILLGALVFLVVGSLIALVWYTTRINALTISTVTVNGGITISDETIKLRVEEKLAGAYLRIIPRRFAYFYPAEEIYTYVSQIERIKDVQIERISGKEIKVTFSEYIPDTLWCSLEEGSKCYFFDNTGYSFGTAPSLTGASMVRYYSPENKAEIGIQPFLQTDYEATKEFTKLLADIGWYVVKVEINSVRDVFYTLARGSEIKATLTEESEKTFLNLQAILLSKEFSHLEPGNFRYIDLRFGTRVFVNEELLVTTASSTPTSTDEVLE